MSKLTEEAKAIVEELRAIEICPSVSTQGYEDLFVRAANVLAELAWMREDSES
jgi:hypothetical protein